MNDYLKSEVVNLNNDKNLTKYEKAEKDYILGMKYKDIAAKYEVSENTVKSWKRRYGWTRESTLKKVCNSAEEFILGNNFKDVKEDLLEQLKANGTYGNQYIDLIDAYMELFKIRNELILDIRDRGVSVEWFNGKQMGIRKNESITELNKTIAIMLSMLNDLGLKPAANSPGFGDDDEDL